MQLRKLLYLALILLTTPIPTTAQFYLSLFSEFNIHDIPAIPTKSLDTRCRALPILQDIASVRNDSTLATSFSNWLSTNQSISNSSLIIQQAQAVLVQLEGYTALAQLCEDAAQVEGTCNATSIAAVNVTLCDNFKAYKSSLPETNAGSYIPSILIVLSVHHSTRTYIVRLSAAR